MTSRDNILGRIRTALAGQTPPVLPPVCEVWPGEKPSADQMFQRFAEELQALHGEAMRCGSTAEARGKLEELLRHEDWPRMAAMDRPLCRELTTGIPPERLAWAAADWTPRSMADMPVGLVAADYFLADTGSAVVVCPTPQDRLMCYLPPVCIVAGTAGQLAEHLPAAWESIGPRAADPGTRGEFVIITGPSRTSDIEKVLTLGVHGPKRLIVMVIG